jgi:hypothetical protein
MAYETAPVKFLYHLVSAFFNRAYADKKLLPSNSHFITALSVAHSSCSKGKFFLKAIRS